MTVPNRAINMNEQANRTKN